MVIHPEVFLAAGYAVFLLGVALGLDLMAQRSHARSQRYRTAGFTYHHTHDAWICPEEQVLVRSETDHERRLVRYRGSPRSQPLSRKSDCTTPTRPGGGVVPWTPGPSPEAGRSTGHLARRRPRGRPDPGQPVASATMPRLSSRFGATFLVVALTAWHLHISFRATTANFRIPQPTRPAVADTRGIPAHGLQKGVGETIDTLVYTLRSGLAGVWLGDVASTT